MLILTLSFGMGHVSAARTVAEGWCKRTGQSAVVWDAIAYFPFWFRLIYVLPYWWMIRYCPWMWRRLFQSRVVKMHRWTVPHPLLKRGARRLLRDIAKLKPSLILAAEVGACEIASMYKSEIDRDVSVAALLTDFQSEPVWVQSGIDLYLVPSDKVARELRRWGARSCDIEVVGIPVSDAFENPVEQCAARSVLGLVLDRHVILMMAGGMGPCHLDRVAIELDRLAQGPLQVVALTGQDSKLLARLNALRLHQVDLVTRGWIDNVPQYMAAADLLITKPGAVTLSEARAMALPTIAIEPLPGPEEENLRHWVQSGAGLSAEDPRQAARLALKLLQEGAPAERDSSGRRSAVSDIVRHLGSLCETYA